MRQRAHPQPGVDLSYIKQSGESNGAAGDQYAGLDRFDRVVDQRWIKTSNTTSTDRFKYGYDESGNVMFKDNVLSSSNSELYHANGSTNGYDSLNRLAAFQRGALNTAKDSISGTVGRSQSWNLDALGNWDGASGVTTDGAAQSRTHNRQNQSTNVGGATLTFDNNGNTTKDENGYTYIYDAWNRLVKESITGVATQDKHAYDALGRRITTGNSANTIPDLYYSNQWQVLEERSGNTVKDQYVWSIAYVDAMVLRDRDAASGGDLGKSGSGLDERLYAQQDANYNVTALVDTSGAVVERFIYDPYGSVTVLDANWAVKNDGAVADSDFNWVYLHQGGRFDDAGFGGLYSFGHRYYSPTLGRWMQQDPLIYVDGTNLYETERSRPPSSSDPTGTQDTPGKTLLWTWHKGIKVEQKNGNSTSAVFMQAFVGDVPVPSMAPGSAISNQVRDDPDTRAAIDKLIGAELKQRGIDPCKLCCTAHGQTLKLHFPINGLKGAFAYKASADLTHALHNVDIKIWAKEDLTIDGTGASCSWSLPISVVVLDTYDFVVGGAGGADPLFNFAGFANDTGAQLQKLNIGQNFDVAISFKLIYQKECGSY